MSDAAQEVRKRFAGYADAITTFATAQFVGFVLLMTRGDCFTRNVLGGLWYSVFCGVAINVAYMVLIVLCHRAEDKISEQFVMGAAVLRGLKIVRYAIILTELLGTALLPFAITYGWRHAQFFIDCKATS